MYKHRIIFAFLFDSLPAKAKTMRMSMSILTINKPQRKKNEEKKIVHRLTDSDRTDVGHFLICVRQSASIFVGCFKVQYFGIILLQYNVF